MGDPNGGNVAGTLQAPPQSPATQAQARAAQAHALAAEAKALAVQAQALLAADNEVDGDQKKVQAYKEIANLHEINLHYPIHKLALEEWKRTEEYLSSSVSRREGRSAELTNQIYNIFGWFAVFLGVVLTAVSQLTQTANTDVGGVPLCGKIWFPVVLTGFATVATVSGILHKFTALQSLESTIHTERNAKLEVAKRASTLRRVGPQKFRFEQHTDNSRLATQPKPFWKNRFWVIVFLVIFTGIFILSYFVILCDTWVVRKWDGGLHRLHSLPPSVMTKTKVKNETNDNIILKEGTGGVYRMICPKLQPKGSYRIPVDTNATYREYWCAVTSENEKYVVLSSDDCMEYKEVRIKLRPDGSYTWDAVKRDSGKLVLNAGDTSAQAQTQAAGGT